MKKIVFRIVIIAFVAIWLVSCSQSGNSSTGVVNAEEAAFYLRAVEETGRGIRSSYSPETGDGVMSRGDAYIFDPLNGYSRIIQSYNENDAVLLGTIDTSIDSLNSASDFPSIIGVLDGNNYGIAYSFSHEIFEYPGHYGFEAMMNNGGVIPLNLMYQAENPGSYDEHNCKLHGGYFSGLHINNYLPEAYGNFVVSDTISMLIYWDGITDSTVVDSAMAPISPELAPYMTEEVNPNWTVYFRTSFSNRQFLPSEYRNDLGGFAIEIPVFRGSYQEIIISVADPYSEHFMGVNVVTEYGATEATAYLNFSNTGANRMLAIRIDENGVPHNADMSRDWRCVFLGIVPTN